MNVVTMESNFENNGGQTAFKDVLHTFFEEKSLILKKNFFALIGHKNNPRIGHV